MSTTDILKEATLPEVLRTKAPDGSYMSAIDVLSERIPLLEEGYWLQANDDSSHEFLRWTSEPVGSPVRLGEGAAWEKAAQVPVKEQLMNLGSNMKLDIKVLAKAPDPVRYRRDMEKVTVRGMTKTFAKTIFSKGGLGDMSTDVRSINGLGVRYGKIAANSVYSLGGNSAGSMGSIWIVKWGPDGLHFLYPKTASKALVEKNMTEAQPMCINDANGNPVYYEVTNWDWQFGLAIGDPRNVKRIGNIAASGDKSFWNDSTDKALGENALIDALEDMPSDLSGCVIYAGKNIVAQMRKRLNSKSNLFFNVRDVWGRPMLAFDEVPIVRMDTLTNDEAVLS